ncbi:MAG: GTP-binding protein [Planctomycetota bacterium]|jgi:hypothetical protein
MSGEAALTLKNYIMKGDAIIISGPVGSGKTTLLEQALKEVGNHKLVPIDMKLLGPDVRDSLLKSVKIPAFEGPRIIWHFPNIDKIDKKFLVALAKTAVESKAVTVVFETTLRRERIGKLKSYCKVVPLTKPAWGTLKKVAVEHGHSFQPKNFHQAIRGLEDLVDKGDFDRITKFFDGSSVVEVEGTFIFWILHNGRAMLGANDKFLLYHYLSSLARNGRLGLAGNLKLKGGGRPSFPYYLKKKSMKREATKT